MITCNFCKSVKNIVLAGKNYNKKALHNDTNATFVKEGLSQMMASGK